MQASVLRSPVPIGNTGRDLDRVESTLDDIGVALDPAAAVGKDQIQPFGQASFHSRSAFTTIGGSGTVRSPGL